MRIKKEKVNKTSSFFSFKCIVVLRDCRFVLQEVKITDISFAFYKIYDRILVGIL